MEAVSVLFFTETTMQYLEKFWEIIFAHIEIIVVALLIFILGYGFNKMVEERKAWEAFKISHACKLVATKTSSVGVGTGVTSNGSVATTTVIIPGQEAWLCDDGVTYWRDN
jgi:hypothetical protein